MLSPRSFNEIKDKIGKNDESMLFKVWYNKFNLFSSEMIFFWFNYEEFSMDLI